MNVCLKYGDSTLNTGGIIRLFAGRTGLSTIAQYLNAFCSRPEESSVVISGKFVGLTIRHKYLKFRDPHLNRSRAIYPKVSEAAFSTVFSLLPTEVQLVMSY